MRDRKKRNIIIGSLCCLLVFMGIGYALLSQTLNINGTATMTGEWKIFIDTITVKELGGSAKSTVAEVSEDKMGASFAVELLKPGDYVEYDVVVKNEGTINAVLRELIPNIESNNMDILLTHSIIQGQILKAESETKFTLKIRFDERATEIVEGGQTSFDIQMVYEQYDGDAESIDPSLVPVTANDCFTVDENGVIIDYDYSCGTYVTVPAVVNNIAVKEISSNAFIQAGNAVIYVKDEAPLPSIVVAQDTETYTEFSALLESMGGAATGITLLMKGDVLPDTTGLEMQKGNIDSNGEFTEGLSGVEYLDLSQASGLTKIASRAFVSDETNSTMKYLNLDGVNVEAIGHDVFDYSNLTELTLTTDIYKIITGKHKINVETLRIYPGTTTVITVDYSDRYSPEIAINKLIIGEGITEIDENVFDTSYGIKNIKNLELPISLEVIGANAFSDSEIESLIIKEGSMLKKIAFRAFYGLQSSYLDLTPLKNHVTIDRGAFYNSQLEKVLIEDATIDQTAFALNSKLKHLELLGDIEFTGEIPAGNEYLTSLEVLRIKSNTIKTINTVQFALSPLTTLEFLNELGTDINSSIKTIGISSFRSANPATLILPTSLETIGAFAFEEANPTTLVMSPAIKNIGTQAFRTLKISELIIPSTIEKIDIGAFEAMPSTSTITINRAEGSFTTVDPWSGDAKVVYNS